MKAQLHFTFLIGVCLLLGSFSSSNAQISPEGFVYGDALPDAPELAIRGNHAVGVRTIEVVNKKQLDLLNSKENNEVFYDRPLTIEVWYPANLSGNESMLTTYEDVLGMANNPERPLVPFSFSGRAARMAAPNKESLPYPFVIVSHGYPGSRVLMTYLCENLASKGYVVAALDHTESTHRDAAAFPSTLLNRSKDVLFLLDEMASLTKQRKHFLSGIVDVNQTGLVGYSMGGYGVLNVAGAGYSDQAVGMFTKMTGGNKALETRSSSNADFLKTIDPRIKAVVAFAPWGMTQGVWDAKGLEGLKAPTLFIAGSLDDVSGYEKGIKAIYEGAINADRYLLTYMNARHNVAPNPPPSESYQPGLNPNEYGHYAEPSWDMRRINNINQHFVTAFLGIHLKQLDHAQYLQLPENSNVQTWEGFKPRTSTGLELLHKKPTQ